LPWRFGQEDAMVKRSPRWLAPFSLMVLLSAGWSCSSNPIGDDGGPPAHDVDIVQDAAQAGPNAFSPSNPVFSLASQNTVTWYNADFSGYGGLFGTAHHLKSDDGTSFDSGVIQAGGVFQATFSAPGIHPYHCEIHSGMTGTVTVDP
jgi:plastocyanin